MKERICQTISKIHLAAKLKDLEIFYLQMLYLPLALFIPPSHFIVHNQFNLIYQLWIHTTVIDDLGPFELIFNTPKHHRVHHGKRQMGFILY